MNIKEQWAQLAEELHFQFHEGVEALITSPHLARIAGEEINDRKMDFSKFSAMLNHPFIKTLLSSVFIGMAAGNYRNFDFFLYRSSQTTSNNRQNHYVNIALFFKTPYNLGLEITSANFWTKLGKKLFPGSYVRLTNPQLEPMLKVKAKERMQTEQLLINPQLQNELKSLFMQSGHFKVTDFGIRLKEPGHIISKEQAVTYMDRMTEAAGYFQP